MANITVLDQNTINKIAAGEVIERPASVVKELVENAIDAKATAITIEIREGGIAMVRVTDNGCGIPEKEIPLAFLRHATSKIRTADDLFSISSLGFRGEALASIAAVSQVELITKTSGSLTGFRYQIQGGQEMGMEEIGAPEGTTFIARNLFFNTPVRKKFLKKPITEGAYVADLVEKLALSHPGVSIRFIQNNQNKLHTSGNHNLKDLAYTVYGREVAANLLPVQGSQGEIQLSGWIGKPVIARGNRNYENYFINGRYVRSSIIYKAIEEAYKPFMMQHKYPFTLIQLEIDPEFLDVNVHPTKMELRFRDPELVYHVVYQALNQALAHKELIPQVSLKQRPLPQEPAAPSQAGEEEKKQAKPVLPKEEHPSPEPFEVRRRQILAKQEEKPVMVREPAIDYQLKAAAPPPKMEKEKSAAPQPSKAAAKKPVQMDLFEDSRFLAKESRDRHKPIGQLFDTYWLVEYRDQLIIIDQHAAHEKILFEQTMNALKTRSFDTQLISPPIILTLSPNEEVLLNRYLDYFTGIGFEIEPFGGREYAVRGVPSNLFSIARRDLLIEMIDGLSDDMDLQKPDLIYEKVASMSCKAAVKGGQALSSMEANGLIEQLLGLENPYNCPHGRPVLISMTRTELEKNFKRIV